MVYTLTRPVQRSRVKHKEWKVNPVGELEGNRRDWSSAGEVDYNDDRCSGLSSGSRR